nr:MAG TPA: hypothetical protein [Caudoviricetes sp.]
MDSSALRSAMWDKHDIVLEGEEKRTAYGVTHGPQVVVRGSINATARTVTAPNGNEVVVSATCRWHPSGPLPKVGAKVTLPAQFGVEPRREVVTARLVDSGTGLTPAHVEVTLR